MGLWNSFVSKHFMKRLFRVDCLDFRASNVFRFSTVTINREAKTQS